MAFDSKGLDDYIDVAQRIAEFRTKHPDGALQPIDPAHPFEVREFEGTGKDGKPIKGTFIVYVAAAYRSPDDKLPGIGCAYEVFPGRTPYTAGSELQNAETAAWGRAIVAALAADTRAGIASKQEMRNRQAEREAEPPPASKPPTAASAQVPHIGKVLRQLHILLTNTGISDRAEKLRVCSAVLGREIGSSRELSDPEIEQVYNKVRELGSRGSVVAFCAERAATGRDGAAEGETAAPPAPEGGAT